MKQVLLIGVDCAVDPANTGLCLAEYREGRGIVIREGCSGAREAPAEIVLRWMAENPGVSLLLGLDAPLGWPAPLARALNFHCAGGELSESANTIFRRHTDDFTALKIGKRPMDVGADRIARTAHAALELLHTVRRRSRKALPLGWTPGMIQGSAVLETYPAAWLKVSSLPDRAYKRPDQRNVRVRILSEIEKRLCFDCSPDPFLNDADILDALLCTLVCGEYLEGRVYAPPADRMDLLLQEGWIWIPDYSASVPAMTSR